MRTFSKFEKKIIRQLVNINTATDPNSNILTFISNVVLQDRGIEFIEKEKTLRILRKFSDNNALNEIFETIALFKYLENNHLIFKHSNLITPFIGNFVSKNITQDFVNQQTFLKEYGEEKIPTNIYDIFNDYKISFMVIGTELKDLVKNEFKTVEQIHHEREMFESKIQTKFSKWSFWIALFALLFSLAVPFVFDTKIEQSQIENIRTDLHKINSAIDTLNVQTKMTTKANIEANIEKLKNTSH